jgi:hypothetical protein
MPRFFEKDPQPTSQLEDPTSAEHLLPEHAQISYQSSPVKDNPLQTLLSWTAPSRPFRRKDRSYYTTIAIIVTLLILIALLIQEFILVGVLLAVTFVAYVLGFVPPEDIPYKLSTQGVTIDNHFYLWGELDSFWLNKKEDQTLVTITTKLKYPAQVSMVLTDENIDQVRQTMAKYLPFHEIPPRAFMDRWAEGLSRFFPLEKHPKPS